MLLAVDVPIMTVIGLISVSVAFLSLLVSFLIRNSSNSKPASFANANGTTHASAAPEDRRQRCTIIYGTQTGTAERFAKSLKSQLEGKYGKHTAFDVVDIENYDFANRLDKEQLIFFLMATYGDGDPVDSAIPFIDWLKELNDEPLLNLSYGVFGLGNKQYEHFAAAGKFVDKTLSGLGASAVVKRGDGDDDDDIDADFDSWCTELFSALDCAPNLVTVNKPGEGALDANSLASYTVEIIPDAFKGSVDILKSGTGLNHHSPYLATIASVRELHSPASERSCVHVEVDISGSRLSYEAGDHIAVFAENSAETVEAAARLLQQPLDLLFQLKVDTSRADQPDPLMSGLAGVLSLRTALARGVDLQSAPNKAALAALAAFATDEEQGKDLRHLASIEGKESYHSYVVEAKRSLLQVMEDHPSAVPTLGAFFGSIAPHLQPRFYSISSSPKMHPISVHITCAVVKEEMPCGRLHRGVASCWLQESAPGQKVPIFIRKSTFKLPAHPNVPIIMVGPGTGIAPFRGFLQDRQALVSRKQQVGEGILFFGCRKRSHDYIYQSELEEFLDKGAISALYTAFSREQANKDYVQHHIKLNGKHVWEVLSKKNGSLFVCGDAKHMAKDVHRTLIEVAKEVDGCTDLAAEAAIKVLSDSGRYLKDVW